MLAIVLMLVVTVLSLYFLIEVKKTSNNVIAEVLLAKAWSNQFERQTLEEKRELYLKQNAKYHTYTQKQVDKKLKEWDKQIADYQKAESQYFAGRKLTLLDAIPLFGYQVMKNFSLDANSDMLRNLSKRCERTGYIELEKNQETAGTSNAQIYAKYLLSSLISFCAVGVILGGVLVSISLGMGLSSAQMMIFLLVGMVAPMLAGYIPYDNLVNKANKRQAEIDRDFPNILSKIALLITAGMNLTNAVAEVAESGETLMYQELQLVIKELNQSSTVAAAFTRMQCRCDNRYLDKVVSVVIKSYSSGNANLAEDLRNINAECWLNKKHEARRMGEAIQNKLFIPTMLMFIGILVVIIVPAMSGFNL